MREIEVKIPIIRPEGIDNFHFNGIDWPLNFTKNHNLFHINRLEEFIHRISFPLPPHRKTVFDIIFLTKGNSIRSKGLLKYEFTAGQLFFLPAYQITSHDYISKDAEGFFLHFDSSIFKNHNLDKFLKDFNFLGFLNHPVVKLDTQSIVAFVNIFERLETLVNETKTNELDLISIYLFALLKESAKFATEEKNVIKNASALLTERYKEALSQYIYTKQKVKEYADYLNVTPNHLNKCVKKTTMKSAQELLNEMLIMEAKSLLKFSNLQISEIAVKLGNHTPSNFARFFKSKTSMMPKDYR
ncbi:Helix-turn-helix, AraC domain-containing protein (plasmid) [Emticicia oligotrophica DSM 17448]|uniref:Helix-turn-helix, AraC domain-containing protein n=1 Tax=Emticicia oligotrophica (strain DSM 17448 / CIP 109782 / MTCC 6937 / GPTSA100-15) TaxID=929562 RepID=A0ABM5N825_EMTOG|nr:AraC family transcriptional regulator [Emticicia oligotrophica]AFK05618.1 Helix-turn-helix, AraC domain-containing protein [Emticicia oligotrophica DSM 17448]